MKEFFEGEGIRGGKGTGSMEPRGCARGAGGASGNGDPGGDSDEVAIRAALAPLVRLSVPGELRSRTRARMGEALRPSGPVGVASPRTPASRAGRGPGRRAALMLPLAAGLAAALLLGALVLFRGAMIGGSGVSSPPGMLAVASPASGVPLSAESMPPSLLPASCPSPTFPSAAVDPTATAFLLPGLHGTVGVDGVENDTGRGNPTEGADRGTEGVERGKRSSAPHPAYVTPTQTPPATASVTSGPMGMPDAVSGESRATSSGGSRTWTSGEGRTWTLGEEAEKVSPTPIPEELPTPGTPGREVVQGSARGDAGVGTGRL